MDAIADAAGVSVKTIYSHFASKDELFRKVMVGACADDLFSSGVPSEDVLRQRFAWFTKATKQGLFEAGKAYLDHLLSEDELKLYRAVTRDTDRFPELGRQYQKTVARGRTGLLIAYLRAVCRKRDWTRRDAVQDAIAYEGLLRAGIFEEALHGLSRVTSDDIEKQAMFASRTMWRLLAAVFNC